jgi:hypothetical protein
MIRNYVLETASAPGTSAAVTLGGPPTGRVSFVSQFGTGQQAFYYATDDTQAECGICTLTAGPPDTLTRPATVLWNSAGTTARLNFTGAVRFYNEVPASQMLYRDASGNIAMANGKVINLAAGATYTDAPQFGQVGWSVIQTQIYPTGTSLLVFALPSQFCRFRLEWQDAAASGSGKLYAQFSTDGGVTYHQGATDYAWFANRLSAGASAQDSASDSGIRLTPAVVANEIQTGVYDFQLNASQQGTFDSTGLANTVFTRCVGAGYCTFSGTPTHLLLAFPSLSFNAVRARLLGQLA